MDKSFVSDHYKETECDFLYKVKPKGKAASIYLPDRISVIGRLVYVITNPELRDQFLDGLRAQP